MKNLQWWFRLDNPRFIYLLTGGMFFAAADCVVRAFDGSLLWASAGGFIAYAGYWLISYQRYREAIQDYIRTAENDAAYTRFVDEVNHINDELESYGCGRPVHVDRLTIH